MSLTEQAGRVIRFPVERRQPERLVALRDLQDAYGGSERWWRYRLKEGMPSHRWGQRLRFSTAEVEDWMRRRYGT